MLRGKGTEAPFSGALLHEKRSGTHACKVCGTALFASDAKSDSGTGWPSFDQALPGAIREVADDSHGMHRTEVVYATCGSHLGHVFNDGPTDTGMPYCLNSVCLNLAEDKEGGSRAGECNHMLRNTTNRPPKPAVFVTAGRREVGSDLISVDSILVPD